LATQKYFYISFSIGYLVIKPACVNAALVRVGNPVIRNLFIKLETYLGQHFPDAIFCLKNLP